MKKAAIQIAALAGVLLVVCVLCRLAMKNTYVVYMALPYAERDAAADSVRFDAEVPGIVAFGDAERFGDYLRVPVRPQARGRTFVDIGIGESDASMVADLRVSPLGTVYDDVTGGFTGDTAVLAAFTAFCLTAAAIMFRAYRQTRGPAFYAYDTIHAAGFSAFALLTGLTMLVVTLRHALRPYEYSMLSAYSAIASASWSFVSLTSPLIVAFAAAMAVSNVELLRHERFRPQNVLGIGVSVMLVAGVAFAYYLFSRDFSGSQRQMRVHETLQNVYATGFAWFECMLLGAIVCGIRAARHVPKADVDYILILGCRFRKDGTLPPLLRGRVDKAIEFWRQQKAQTGREAVLMPSGGQGPDEVMPEAEAMRRYLLEQGVPENRIAVEDRSRNTYQNMAFSKALIERDAPDARVAYVTTNYHVFRSGVWASLAGLRAEGLGSRTKWWFWPNAFMRECAGLLRNRVWQELVLLAVLLAFFGALSVALI